MTMLNRLRRIPTRIKEDSAIVRLARNWPALLSAKLKRRPVREIRLRNGVSLEGPPENDLAFLFNEIWIDKVYSPPGFEINDGDVVVDIGGNIGVFALFAASHAKNVTVLSYEPFPANAKAFQNNCDRSDVKDVTLNELGVAGSRGKRSLAVAESWVAHSLSNGDEDSERIEIETTTLDDIVEQIGSCDLLKIDCEGSEYEIFGAAKPATFEKIGKIVCEYHNRPDGDGESLCRLFEQNGFEISSFRKLDEETGLICARNRKFAKAEKQAI